MNNILPIKAYTIPHISRIQLYAITPSIGGTNKMNFANNFDVKTVDFYSAAHS